MVADSKIYSELGYHYTKYSKENVEFHIDYHLEFQGRCKNLPYDGNLSMRKDPSTKVLVILDGEKAIFNK